MDPKPKEPVPRWLSMAAAWSWRLLVVAAAVVMVGVAFSRLEVVVVPIFGALLLTTVLGPPARWLRRHGVPAAPATWLVFLGALAVLGGIAFGLAPSVSHEFSALGRELSRGVRKTEHWLERGPLHLSARQIDGFVRRARSALSSNGAKVARGALSGVTVVAEGAAGILLTLVLTFFFVKDGDAISSWFLGVFSDRRAADLRVVGERIWSTLVGYVRGTAANGVINAAVLSVGLLVLGVPLVVPVAILTFVAGFIPLVGAIVSGAVAALLALVARGPVAAGVVIGLTILIHNLEGYLVGPLVLGRAVRLHPVAIVISLAVGTILLGIIGAFVAVPVTAVLLAVHQHYRSARLEVQRDPAPVATLHPPA